jgi:hypothetical protein
MRESDIKRILNFLTGNETVQEFESWIYEDTELESRIGSEFYFELININYKTKDFIDNASKALLNKHISHEEFKRFKYYKILQESGWTPNRKIDLNLRSSIDTSVGENALKIIGEFGGLELTSVYEANYWTPRNIQFQMTPDRIINVKEYGINKDLICFASIDDGNSALYVDEINNFYQLDDIANVDLYRFKDRDFIEMMQSLLGLEEQDNFQLVGKKNKVTEN